VATESEGDDKSTWENESLLVEAVLQASQGQLQAVTGGLAHSEFEASGGGLRFDRLGIFRPAGRNDGEDAEGSRNVRWLSAASALPAGLLYDVLG
jgi:hypothetical protein